jgi:hypothetical protein
MAAIGSFRVWMMVSERASVGQPARLPPGGFYGCTGFLKTSPQRLAPQGATSPETGSRSG